MCVCDYHGRCYNPVMWLGIDFSQYLYTRVINAGLRQIIGWFIGTIKVILHFSAYFCYSIKVGVILVRVVSVLETVSVYI